MRRFFPAHVEKSTETANDFNSLSLLGVVILIRRRVFSTFHSIHFGRRVKPNNK